MKPHVVIWSSLPPLDYAFETYGGYSVQLTLSFRSTNLIDRASEFRDDLLARSLLGQ
jgi:hypothetical protein